MWKYYFSKESIKILKRIGEKSSKLIKQKIRNIGDWLDNKTNLLVDIKKLKGEWKGFYRLRVGKIRIIFSIDVDNKIIKIYDIGSRGNIY